MVYITIQMEVNMKGNGRIITQMDMEYIITLLNGNMKENGKMA